MFTPIQYDSGKLVKLPVTAATFNKGDGMATSGGYYQAASTSASSITHVAMETLASAPTAGDKYLMLRVAGVVFEADCDANSATTYAGTVVDLVNSSHLDIDSSTDDQFYVEEIVGATTDNKVQGWFTFSPTQT